MEIGKRFDDIDSYNKSMSNAMKDKMFFVNELPNDKDYLFFDFGCADGTMINNLIDYYPNNQNIYIGYDCSDTMIALAKTNFRENAKALFTSNWEEAIEYMSTYKCYRPTVLILSSVIHEVYSYAKSEEDIKQFWDRVKNTGFDYIIIRDMMPRRNIVRQTSPNDLGIFSSHYTVSDKDTRISEFVKIHGTLFENKNFVHFLLKYRWTTNWQREVNENYFPIFLEDLLDTITEPPYQLVYLNHFQIPFLVNQIKMDTGITLKDNTHIKLIFKKIDND